MDVPPLFYACICFCMGSGDPLHTPRALGTAGHLAGTFPHQWRGQGPLPFRRFPHQRVRSRLLFLVGLLLSGPRNLVLSQAHRKVSLRSSVLYAYFLAGRRSSASTSTDWLKLLLLCVFLFPPTCPLLQVRLYTKATRKTEGLDTGAASAPAVQAAAPTDDALLSLLTGTGPELQRALNSVRSGSYTHLQHGSRLWGFRPRALHQ
jgi:hypothetical protein